MIVPKYTMAGYTVMMKEIVDQIYQNKISHIILQAGVGGMAGAMIAGVARYLKNLPEIISSADIIVGAVGIPKFIKSDWIKDNAVVVDAGYHPEKCGDIDLEGVISRSFAYTPVPGGVGPMTINTLIMQTLESCEAKIGID